MKVKENNRKIFIVSIICVCIACILLIWPLVRPGMFVSDDGDWMIIRLSAFFQSFREGQFPVRFLQRLNYSYGYPVANFLYPGFLYIGTIIHIIGFSFPDTIKMILGLSIIGAAAVLFLWLREDFDSWPSAIGVFSFLLSPYFLFDIYTRGSVGEVLAFFPALLGFYSIRAKKVLLFPFALAFLVVSHNSLALLFFIVLILYIAALRRHEFWLPMGLGVGLAAFFWIPALMEKKFVIFDALSISQPKNYFVAGQFLKLIGIVSIASWFIVILKGQFKKQSTIFFLTVFGISMFLATQLSSIVWSDVSFARLFQFPYRFLSIAGVAGAWLTALVIQTSSWRTKILFIVCIAIISGVSYWNLMKVVVNVIRPEGYYTTNEATTTVADEYMPRWVIDKPTNRISSRMEFFTGRGTIEKKVMSTQRIIATIDAKEKSVIQINSIYYPGWGVSIDDQPAKINYGNRQGVIRVAVPDGIHTLFAEFRETVPRFLADCVSLISLIVYIAYVFIQLTKRKFSVHNAKTAYV